MSKFLGLRRIGLVVTALMLSGYENYVGRHYKKAVSSLWAREDRVKQKVTFKCKIQSFRTVLPAFALCALFHLPASADYIRGHVTGASVYNNGSSKKLMEVTMLADANWVYPYSANHRETHIKKIVTVLNTKIPRGLITGCSPYSSKGARKKYRVERLPDKVTCGSLKLDYFYPSGKPYTGRQPKLKDLMPLTMGHGYKPEYKKMKHKKMIGGRKKVLPNLRRALAMIIEIRNYSDVRNYPSWDPKLTYMSRHIKFLRKFEGFDEYGEHQGTVRYYYDNGPDEIRYIKCGRSVEKSHLSHWCAAEFPINQYLYANVKFIDFRLNGGREFLRERIRNFKKIMCPYLNCDKKSLHAANITGGQK